MIVIIHWSICVLFGLLCMYAAACQLNVPRHKYPCLLMIAGGFALVCAVAAAKNGMWWDWLVALGGCAAICAAAIWNGLADGIVHWKHHLVRIIICCFLVEGFLLLPARIAPEEPSTLREETQIGETTLSDGTAVQLWQRLFGDTAYRLEDGTDLLRERTSGPEHVYVGGQESFDDLADDAQKAVRAYYEDRGLLYDAQAILEDAYERFQAAPHDFDCWALGQDVAPLASNDRIMSFITTVTLPLGGRIVTERRLGDVFDRNTGEHLDNSDLFTVPLDEAAARMLDAAGIAQPLREEMISALEPEYITLHSDSIELAFPEGSLPSQEYSYIVCVDLEDCPLRDWAVPYASRGADPQITVEMDDLVPDDIAPAAGQ